MFCEVAKGGRIWIYLHFVQDLLILRASGVCPGTLYFIYVLALEYTQIDCTDVENMIMPQHQSLKVQRRAQT
jgi:hypothetical protein